MVQAAELTAKVGMEGAKEAAKDVENLTKEFGFLGNVAANSLSFLLEWAGKSFKKGAEMAAGYAREIDVVTYKNKLSTETYQKLDQAFKQHQGNIQDFISVYENLQMRMADWKYHGISGAEGEVYNLLGINPVAYDDAFALIKDVTKALNAEADAGERARKAGILGFNQELLRIADKSKYFMSETILQTEEETEKLRELEQVSQSLSNLWDGLWAKIGAKSDINITLPIKKLKLSALQGITNFLFGSDTKKVSYTADDLFDLKDNHGTSPNGRHIMKRLMDAGYSKEWAAAMVGGLGFESKGFKTNALGDEEIGGSYGLAQWHGGRWRALKNFAEAQGKSESDIDVQIDYLLHELLNDFHMTPQKANQMSFHDAAKWSLETFENPRDKSERMLEKRKGWGLPYLQMSDNYGSFGMNPPVSESNKSIVNNFYTDMVINADKADQNLLQNTTSKFMEQYLNDTSMSILERQQSW